MTMEYSVAQKSHQGGRDYNEDSTAIFERDGAVLLIVADGLGGHAGGEIASQTLVEAISESFKKATDSQLDNAETFLTLSINFAHHMIHRRAVSRGFKVDSPKTTCVVCLIIDGVAQWAHSGDSRLYVLNKREIISVTEDHVSNKNPQSENNPINRCVGGLELPRPEISEPYKLGVGDTLMLASDGAWHSFTPADLLEYVNPEHPTLGLDNLLQKLEGRNRSPSDNLSMVIFFWGVLQQDTATFNEFIESNTVTLLGSHRFDDDSKSAGPKFDMTSLDKTITEIESFIVDVEDKI